MHVSFDITVEILNLDSIAELYRLKCLFKNNITSVLFL